MVYDKNMGFRGDYTLAKANVGLTLEFYHVAADRLTSFKAMVTNLSDRYESQWEEEEIYGRMDSIQTYKSTKRVIDVSWDVVAGSLEEAKFNMDKMAELASILYPVYDRDNTQGMVAPPLMRIQFGNLITREPKPASARETGLLGACSGFNFEPDMEDVFYSDGAKQMYPKIIRLSCSFSVIHEKPLGFKEGSETRKEKRTPTFPYGSAGPKESEFQERPLTAEQIAEQAAADAINEYVKDANATARADAAAKEMTKSSK